MLCARAETRRKNAMIIFTPVIYKKREIQSMTNCRLLTPIAPFLKDGNKREEADDAVYWAAVPITTSWLAD
jgi:hypothetical protein